MAELAQHPIRDITCVNELSYPYIQKIADLSSSIYRELNLGNVNFYTNTLPHRKVALLFAQKSTRTYDSFLDAFLKLGTNRIVGMRNASESSLGKGETIFHTIDTYIGQGDGTHFIVIRSNLEGTAKWAQIAAYRSYAKKVREFAKTFQEFPRNLVLPIIFNGGDSFHNHPSQLLLDVATLNHVFKRITDFDFGDINDLGGSRVVSSHIDAAKILNWRMHFCALPGAELNQRQKFALNQAPKYYEYKSLSKMLGNIDFLYVNRYQYNLRGETHPKKNESFFSKDHPQISLDLVAPHQLRVMHARPIDKYYKEIHPSLWDHELDISGVQSDLGTPTRMAMCLYAIENQLFTLPGIIATTDLFKLGYYQENLNHTPKKKRVGSKYTTALINHGYVIDHIPLGCGTVMSQLIKRFFPDVTIVTSTGVQGKQNQSNIKDVIKIHTNQRWTRELTNIVGLFSNYTQNKSCRISQFKDGIRVDKWTYKYPLIPMDSCINTNCITHGNYMEDICFRHMLISEKLVCPFCETVQ